jgi:hypothetical protein
LYRPGEIRERNDVGARIDYFESPELLLLDLFQVAAQKMKSANVPADIDEEDRYDGNDHYYGHPALVSPAAGRVAGE